jgi:hypothetical protein
MFLLNHHLQTENETYECVTLILNVFVELLTWHELNDAANESLKKVTIFFRCSSIGRLLTVM